jgi:hypothetical protein
MCSDYPSTKPLSPEGSVDKLPVKLDSKEVSKPTPRVVKKKLNLLNTFETKGQPQTTVKKDMTAN